MEAESPWAASIRNPGLDATSISRFVAEQEKNTGKGHIAFSKPIAIQQMINAAVVYFLRAMARRVKLDDTRKDSVKMAMTDIGQIYLPRLFLENRKWIENGGTEFRADVASMMIENKAKTASTASGMEINLLGIHATHTNYAFEKSLYSAGDTSAEATTSNGAIVLLLGITRAMVDLGHMRLSEDIPTGDQIGRKKMVEVFNYDIALGIVDFMFVACCTALVEITSKHETVRVEYNSAFISIKNELLISPIPLRMSDYKVMEGVVLDTYDSVVNLMEIGKDTIFALDASIAKTRLSAFLDLLFSMVHFLSPTREIASLYKKLLVLRVLDEVVTMTNEELAASTHGDNFFEMHEDPNYDVPLEVSVQVEDEMNQVRDIADGSRFMSEPFLDSSFDFSILPGVDVDTSDNIPADSIPVDLDDVLGNTSMELTGDDFDLFDLPKTPKSTLSEHEKEIRQTTKAKILAILKKAGEPQDVLDNVKQEDFDLALSEDMDSITQALLNLEKNDERLVSLMDAVKELEKRESDQRDSSQKTIEGLQLETEHLKEKSRKCEDDLSEQRELYDAQKKELDTLTEELKAREPDTGGSSTQPDEEEIKRLENELHVTNEKLALSKGEVDALLSSAAMKAFYKNWIENVASAERSKMLAKITNLRQTKKIKNLVDGGMPVDDILKSISFSVDRSSEATEAQKAAEHFRGDYTVTMALPSVRGKEKAIGSMRVTAPISKVSRAFKSIPPTKARNMPRRAEAALKKKNTARASMASVLKSSTSRDVTGKSQKQSNGEQKTISGKSVSINLQAPANHSKILSFGRKTIQNDFYIDVVESKEQVFPVEETVVMESTPINTFQERASGLDEMNFSDFSASAESEYEESDPWANGNFYEDDIDASAEWDQAGHSYYDTGYGEGVYHYEFRAGPSPLVFVHKQTHEESKQLKKAQKDALTMLVAGCLTIASTSIFQDKRWKTNTRAVFAQPGRAKQALGKISTGTTFDSSCRTANREAIYTIPETTKMICDQWKRMICLIPLVQDHSIETLIGKLSESLVLGDRQRSKDITRKLCSIAQFSDVLSVTVVNMVFQMHDAIRLFECNEDRKEMKDCVIKASRIVT